MQADVTQRLAEPIDGGVTVPVAFGVRPAGGALVPRLLSTLRNVTVRDCVRAFFSILRRFVTISHVQLCR